MKHRKKQFYFSIAAFLLISTAIAVSFAFYTRNTYVFTNVNALMGDESSGHAECYIQYHVPLFTGAHVYICGTCEFVRGVGDVKGGVCNY